jgi:myo-inositol 2-dehydrogenase / D-chiro-inositol 1-dehydrogenase
MNTNNGSNRLATRRHFIKTSSAALIGGAFAANLSFPGKSFAENSDTLKIGLIGCGGRGSGAASQALMADKNVVLTAMGDAFDNRLQSSLKNLKGSAEFGDRVKVTPETSFVGFDAYQKVIDSGVDVVLLATPPGFRPYHLKAAVAAGKHVFCEKPMATDAPGLRVAMEAAQEAKKKKLSLVSGFCWRYNLAERAGFQQVLDGNVGLVRAVYSTYNTGTLWSFPRKPEWTEMEYQMRNWYYFTWLSGDHLVEQACHSIDKMSWAMNDVPPVRATAHAGRQVRTGPEFGHIYDHFAIVYEYANGSKGFLFTRQQDNCSQDNTDTILGTKGIARILGFAGKPEITGEKNWKYEGPRPDMYQIEHNELFKSIREGAAKNDGDWMLQSTRLALLGRMAAYTGKTIKWEESLSSQENLMPERLAWDAPVVVPTVAMPGKTPFI